MAEVPDRFKNRERVRFPDGNYYRIADDVARITLDWGLGMQPKYEVEMKERQVPGIEELVEQGYIVPVGEDEEEGSHDAR